MFKISKDDRHSDIVIVNITEISQSMLSQWRAAFKMGKDKQMQFSANGIFNPNHLVQRDFDAFVGSTIIKSTSNDFC